MYDLTRCVALEKDGFEPKTWSSTRRVGRPCLRWTRCVQLFYRFWVGGQQQVFCTGSEQAGVGPWPAAPCSKCWRNMSIIDRLVPPTLFNIVDNQQC